MGLAANNSFRGYANSHKMANKLFRGYLQYQVRTQHTHTSNPFECTGVSGILGQACLDLSVLHKFNQIQALPGGVMRIAGTCKVIKVVSC